MDKDLIALVDFFEEKCTPENRAFKTLWYYSERARAWRVDDDTVFLRLDRTSKDDRLLSTIGILRHKDAITQLKSAHHEALDHYMAGRENEDEFTQRMIQAVKEIFLYVDEYINESGRLRNLIDEKAKALDCAVLALEIMPDHVHLFINAHPRIAPYQIMHEIKGYSARVLRSEFKDRLSHLPSMWTRSYFVSTDGNLSGDIIRRYVEEQKTK